MVQTRTPLPAPAGCGLRLPAGLAEAPGARALGASAVSAGGLVRGAVAAPAAAHSEAVRLADRLGAPQAPRAPAPSERDANFRASGGIKAGSEAVAGAWAASGGRGME